MAIRGAQCHQLNEDSTNPCKNDIAANLRDYREEICGAIGSVDPELAGLLVQKGTITTDESELVSKSQQKARKGVDYVLERVETRGGEAFNDLLWCLDQTGKSNIGHRYAAALLRKECSLDMLRDILTSTKLRQKYQEPKVMKLTRSLQVKQLIPYLMKNQLVTENEVEELTHLTRMKGVLRLLRMLDQKGPLAHLYLTMALIDAKDNSHLHEEILKETLLQVDCW
jgi:hypothetical protein